MTARRTATKTKAANSPSKRNRRSTARRASRSSSARPGPAASKPAPKPQAEEVKAAPQEPQMRDDPRLDRRIIEGMLTDRNGLLEQLSKEGIQPAAVLRRAADLGLSEAYIRQVQGVAADLAGERPGGRKAPLTLGARTCLSCDRVFLSSGPGNRLCMRCRGGDAGLAQL